VTTHGAMRKLTLFLAGLAVTPACTIDLHDPDVDVGDVDVGDDEIVDDDDDDADDEPVNDPDDDDPDGSDGDGPDDDPDDDADDGDVGDDIEDDDPQPDADDQPLDVTIYDLQRGDVDPGTRVRVSGAVVVGNHARFGFHVQDPGGGPYSGIWIFDGAHEVSEGDEVELVGIFREVDGGRSGTLSIVDLTDAEGSFEVTGRGPVPSPQLVDAQTLASTETAEPWEGVLVRIADVTVLDPTAPGGAFLVDEGVPVDDLYLDFRVEEQDRFDAIAGVVFFSGDRYQLAPRFRVDFEGFVQTGDDCVLADVCAEELRAGDLVVTEVFPSPDDNGACDDETGEWFEVWNTLLQPVSLNGVVVVDENGESTELIGGVIEPRGYAVVGAWSPDFCYDPPAARFDTQGLLLDENDTITLRNPDSGETIDVVSWTNVDEGVAIGLDPELPIGASENDETDNWCDQSSVIPESSDLGTPGAENDECPDGDVEG
jgi:hypothetical protein